MKSKDVTPLEVARRAEQRLDAIYPLLRVGRIPARLENGRWWIREVDLENYLAQRAARKARTRNAEAVAS